MNVERTEIYFEDEKDYVPFEGELGFFEIDYGDEAKTPFEMANLEKLEIGSLIMLNVGEEVNVGFSNTHSDFETLDDKYDAVSTELKSINDKISNMDGNISKLVDHLGKIIDHFIEDRTKSKTEN